jgi:hypothetical protein
VQADSGRKPQRDGNIQRPACARSGESLITRRGLIAVLSFLVLRAVF